jgi:hypothetical protein
MVVLRRQLHQMIKQVHDRNHDEHSLPVVGLMCVVLLDECLCRNPTLKECEDDTHTPKMGTWEPFGTPKNSEPNCRGQNTSP